MNANLNSIFALSYLAFDIKNIDNNFRCGFSKDKTIYVERLFMFEGRASDMA
jgi:hypothetical protein